MKLQPSIKIMKRVAPALGLILFGAPLVASWLLALFIRSLPIDGVAYIPVAGTLFSFLGRPEGYWYYFMDAAAFIASGLLLWYVWKTDR
jgi:hypothetical protein